MPSPPAQVFSDVQSLDLNTEVFLFKLSAFNDNDLNQSAYFCAHLNVKHNGQTYLTIDCALQGYRISSESQSRPTLKIGDAEGIISGLRVIYGSLEGAELEVRSIFAQYLDGQPTANPNNLKFYEFFKIARLTNEAPGVEIEYELCHPAEFVNETIGREVSPKCTWEYKDPETCGYTGTLPTCGRTPNACAQHFGAGAALPGSFFPGL